MRSGAVASMRTVESRPGGLLDPGSYWHKAELAITFMLAVVAVRIHEFFPGVSVLKPVLLITVVGTFLVYRNSSRSVRARVWHAPLAVIVLLYFLAVCLTVPFALWQGGAFQYVRGLVPAVLLVLGFQMIPPRRETLDRLQFTFVVLVLFFAWYIQTFGRMFGGRLVSVSGTYDSNDVASILAMALPMAIAILMRLRGVRRKLAAGVAIVAIVGGIIATGSRGGALALVAGAVVFVLGLNSGKAILVMYFMAMGAGAAWFLAPPTFRNRIHSLSNLQNDYNTTDELGRKAVWRRGRLYFLEHPIVGVGAGNFPQAEGIYNETVGRTGKWSAAHNAYIQAFVELGSVGGGTFVIMLLMAARIAYRSWRPRNPARGPPFHRPELLAALVAYMTGAMFLSHAYFHPLFALIAFILLSQRIREAEALGGMVDAGMLPIAEVPAPVQGRRGGLSTAAGSHHDAGRRATAVRGPERGGLAFFRPAGPTG